MCLKNECWIWVSSGQKRPGWVGFEKEIGRINYMYGYIDIEILRMENIRAEGCGDEELWLLKRPFEIRQSGTSPFFEGEAELQKKPNITPVCAANIHRQKNGGLERT